MAGQRVIRPDRFLHDVRPRVHALLRVIAEVALRSGVEAAAIERSEQGTPKAPPRILGETDP
jgi:hypothetical protein